MHTLTLEHRPTVYTCLQHTHTHTSFGSHLNNFVILEPGNWLRHCLPLAPHWFSLPRLRGVTCVFKCWARHTASRACSCVELEAQASVEKHALNCRSRCYSCACGLNTKHISSSASDQQNTSWLITQFTDSYMTITKFNEMLSVLWIFYGLNAFLNLEVYCLNHLI